MGLDERIPEGQAPEPACGQRPPQDPPGPPGAGPQALLAARLWQVLVDGELFPGANGGLIIGALSC